MTNDVEDLFMCLMTTHKSSFVQCLSFFCSFFALSFITDGSDSSCIDINHFSNIYREQIFSASCLPFLFLNVIF